MAKMIYSSVMLKPSRMGETVSALVNEVFLDLRIKATPKQQKEIAIVVAKIFQRNIIKTSDFFSNITKKQLREEFCKYLTSEFLDLPRSLLNKHESKLQRLVEGVCEDIDDTTSAYIDEIYGSGKFNTFLKGQSKKKYLNQCFFGGK